MQYRILIVILLIALCGAFACDAAQQAPIGKETFLDSGMEDAPIATSEDSFDRWIKAKAAKDTHGMAQLMLTGSIFLVKNGTRVLVIDSATFKTKVRILGGNQTGRSGWVPYEYVK